MSRNRIGRLSTTWNLVSSELNGPEDDSEKAADLKEPRVSDQVFTAYPILLYDVQLSKTGVWQKCACW
jgi:hypothetical protein